MTSEGASFGSVDEYIASFPDDARAALETVRAVIRRAVPDVTEAISYDMATFNVDGRYFVYLAGWKRHVSLHAVPDLPAELELSVAPLRSGRGTVRLRLGRPIPTELVGAIVAHMAAQRRT